MFMRMRMLNFLLRHFCAFYNFTFTFQPIFYHRAIKNLNIIILINLLDIIYYLDGFAIER